MRGKHLGRHCGGPLPAAQQRSQVQAQGQRVVAGEEGHRTLQFNNTNRLVKNPNWDIGLQKTGFITEAGQCLVMQTRIAGRKLIMVFLDSAGKLSRLGDAERVRRWVERSHAATGADAVRG